ncbi:Uncharacterised protein [Mycobacterium tuberculosis]|uniref:Uncharacterized protein n=1 Tax=Mycobacterium tuberculosis TaxID=1773 RepID=A0A916LBI5_MYCTX|nr:Uncharacterised protein [Mycobacterium tuberculosis]
MATSNATRMPSMKSSSAIATGSRCSMCRRGTIPPTCARGLALSIMISARTWRWTGSGTARSRWGSSVAESQAARTEPKTANPIVEPIAR